MLINQSIHTLDLLLHFLGRPKKVHATMSNHHLAGKISVEDTGDAAMTPVSETFMNVWKPIESFGEI